MTADDQDALREALRRGAAALKAADVPFALGGSYALWVFGAPEPEHDVDLIVRPECAERAADVLADAGFDIEHPVEDWIVKAHLGTAMVDLLHRQNGVPVTDDDLAKAVERDVLALKIPVLPPQPVITVKLLALDEHNCDFENLLEPVRAVREQLDWDALAAAADDNDFAYAFVVLARRLGLAAKAQ